MNLRQIRTAQAIIAANRTVDNPTELFCSMDVVIFDPHLDESGRFEVDPETHYGKLYTDWVESL